MPELGSAPQGPLQLFAGREEGIHHLGRITVISNEAFKNG